MTDKLKSYTDYLISILDCFDFNGHGWPEITITDEDGTLGTAMVCEELADTLSELREAMEDNNDY